VEHVDRREEMLVDPEWLFNTLLVSDKSDLGSDISMSEALTSSDHEASSANF
jgi:hypothetical protein